MIDRARRIGAPLLLLMVLAVAGAVGFDGGLTLNDPAASSARQLSATLDELPDDALVLVGFDPDVGTYGEVRSTVRSLLADLLARDARLAFVSLTAEGRALALAELDRLREAGADAARIDDLGFIPGSEAALVAISRAVTGGAPLVGPAAASGLDALAMVVVIGGNDIGPRSWVEQALPRIGDVRMVAVVPSVLLPEVEPYRESGQLAALIATPRQSATYRASLDAATLGAVGDTSGPAPVAVLIGLLVAIGFMGSGIASRVLGALRVARGRERA